MEYFQVYQIYPRSFADSAADHPADQELEGLFSPPRVKTQRNSHAMAALDHVPRNLLECHLLVRTLIDANSIRNDCFWEPWCFSAIVYPVQELRNANEY